jgi:hypothetical protein
LNEPARPSAVRPLSIRYLFRSTSLHSRVDPCCVSIQRSGFLIKPERPFTTAPFCAPASHLSDPCGLPPASAQPAATPHVTLKRATLPAAPPQALRATTRLVRCFRPATNPHSGIREFTALPCAFGPEASPRFSVPPDFRVQCRVRIPSPPFRFCSLLQRNRLARIRRG